MNDTIIQMNGIDKSFYGQKALDGVDFTLRRGEIHSLLGENGAGKTTLMNILYGLYIKDAGDVYLNGDLVNFSKPINAISNGIGMVHQHFMLEEPMSVYENIVLPIELDGNKVDKAYVNELIEILGIGEKLQNLPGHLSGGQQQRVAIARALAAKPAIVLADEPTGNLDSRTSQDVLGLLKVTGEKFGQTIVMITHNPDLAQLADRIVRIEDGKIVNRKECEANA